MSALALLLLLAGAPLPMAATATGAPAISALDGAPARLPVQVGLRRTQEIAWPGATAAFAVDDGLVAVSVTASGVRLYGIRPGTTLVTVVTAGGAEYLTVKVDPPRPALAPRRFAAGAGPSSFEIAFDSQTARLALGLDTSTRQGPRTLRLRVASVTGTDPAAGAESGMALPFLALSVESSASLLMLGDERAVVSPLTLDGSSLRGVHWTSERLQVHAGWASATLYKDFLLPAERESAAGVSYALRRGESRLMPSVYVFAGGSPYGGGAGGLATLLYGYRRSDGRLRADVEVGFGGRAVGAADLSYTDARLEGRIAGRHQPDGTASLGLGRPHGDFLEGDGSARLGARLMLSSAFSIDRSEASRFSHRSEAASAELRFQAARPLWLRTGARYASYRPVDGVPAVRSVTLPVEARLTCGRGSLSALYRVQQHSGVEGRSGGGRLSGAIRLASIRASVYVDWQPAAVSLQSIFDGHPGLARALDGLGLSVQTPDDLARLLRENAALAELGYFDPASLRFDADRRQVGLDLSWTPAPRQRIEARALFDRTQAGGVVRDTNIATLAYSRPLAGFDVLTSVSVYSGPQSGGPDPSFRIGLRRSIDGLPSLPSLGGGTIAGRVFRDDDRLGRPGRDSVGVAGAELRLDDGRVTVTDEEGRFRFPHASRQARRVELTLPAGAYFTTASSVEARAGRDALFGVSFRSARLSGRVRDDAGDGVAGVRLRLGSAAETTAVATTDSGGGFALDAPPGDYVLELETASLPPGIAAATNRRRELRLSVDAPRREEFEVVAQRSLAGRVAGAPNEPGARVCLLELDRCTTSGPDGRYLLRGLPAGEFTLSAAASGRAASRAVTIPTVPGAVGGVELDLR